jgi:transcriptional regulator with XRE-family HTH domain
MTRPTPPSEPQTLGGLIRSGREAQGLSYGQLAELIGATKSMVYGWEHDRFVPKAKSLAALARVLELSTTELTTLSGADYPHDAPSLPAMLRAEYDLPPEAIEQVQRYVERMARKHATPEPEQRSSSNQERRNS